MKIRRHRLIGASGEAVPLVPTPNRSGELHPHYLVIHYTAGRSVDGAVAHMSSKTSRPGVHLVIGRDGAIVQMAPFNRVVWHAGRIQWLGRTGLNRSTIGIELDNAGPMTGGPGKWRAWFGGEYADEDVVLAAHPADGEQRGWHRYTEAQLQTALDVSSLLVARYGLSDVLGHDEIAPGRKLDPGPAFPMAHFRSALFGRTDDAPEQLVTTAALNIREGPGTGFRRLDGSPLPAGLPVTPHSRAGHWHHVEVVGPEGFPDMTGWVHGGYLALADESIPTV